MTFTDRNDRSDRTHGARAPRSLRNPAPPFRTEPADDPALAQRKAQYAAWRDRLRQRDEVEETTIDLEAEARQANWSLEALFADVLTADDQTAQG